MNFIIFAKDNLLKIIFLLILVIGLVASIFLLRTQQNLKSSASENSDITFISPKPGVTILGNTAIRAKITTTLDPSFLIAELRVDGASYSNLNIEKADNNTAYISGSWENSQVPDGDHQLEIYVYNEASNPPLLVGKSSISIKSTTP